MKSKQEIIERLKGNISDLEELRKDINAWDIYHDDNWKYLIEAIQEAVDYLEAQK